MEPADTTPKPRSEADSPAHGTDGVSGSILAPGSMKSNAWRTMVIAGLAAAAIWAFSPWLAGHAEPWDADGFFYFSALLIAGFVSGLLAPKPLWAHYAGAVAGQLIYALIFIPVGPLIVLGVAFLLGYCVIFTAAAAAGGQIRLHWSGRGNPDRGA